MTFAPGAYDVERQVFSGRYRRFYQLTEGMSVPDQQAVTNILVGAFGVKPITVRRRGGAPSIASYATNESRRVTMGALAGPALVCHEVAHILTGQNGHNDDGYGHGPTWQAHYASCVRVIFGDDLADRLATAFAKFEADKTKNRRAAAAKRGRKRSTQTAGPRVRKVEVVKVQTRSMSRKGKGSTTLAWGHDASDKTTEIHLAIRYRTSKGWYWRVTGYTYGGLGSQSPEVWDDLALGRLEDYPPLFTEGLFSTKAEALSWASKKAAQR